MPTRLRRQNAVRLESVGVLVVLCVVASLVSPFFLSVGNVLNVFIATSVIGILAVGATFVITSAAIDLSIASILALTAVIAGVVSKWWGLPWYAAVAAAVATGAFVGWVNGLLVT